jgi:hypothetical protein
MAGLTVSPLRATASPSRIRATWLVRNGSRKEVWVVSSARHQELHGKTLTVYFAELEFPGVRYYAYPLPRLKRLSPGESLRVRSDVQLPLERVELSRGHRLRVVREGLERTVRLQACIGSLATRFARRTADPLTEFVKAQQITQSPPRILHL